MPIPVNNPRAPASGAAGARLSGASGGRGSYASGVTGARLSDAPGAQASYAPGSARVGAPYAPGAAGTRGRAGGPVRTAAVGGAGSRAETGVRAPARSARGRGLVRLLAGRLGVARAAARRDRGQVALEFVAMTPAILAIVVVLWQAALVGYTFVLAGNAADRAARAAAVDDDCQAAARQDLPAAWQASVSCGPGADGLVTARVELRVPLLFPGAVNMPITVPGTAAAAKESDR